MTEDQLDDLALRRLSVPASAPGGMSRRRFLQLAGAGAGVAAGAATFGSVLDHVRAFAAPPIGPNDGVLVLVMLEGGNDGLNTLVPFGDPRYYQLRPRVAIPQANALALDGSVGLHPSLTKIKGLYDQGKVAIVRGLGYQPPDLSHFTSMGICMNGWGGPNQPGGPTGWIGRFLDGLPNAANESLLGAVIGTSVPLHMVGSVARASGLPESIGEAFGLDRREPADARMFDTVAAFGAGPTRLGQWGDMVGHVEQDTLDLAQRIQPAYSGTSPNTDLGRQLVLAARLVNANLGIRVLSTAIGGFDNHSDEPGTHADRMSELDGAVDAFFQTISPIYRSRVTVMTFSEFGRRPEDNDTIGTDHGTASVQFLFGDRVNGGLHGQQPSLDALDPDGNLVRAVDFRQSVGRLCDEPG